MTLIVLACILFGILGIYISINSFHNGFYHLQTLAEIIDFEETYGYYDNNDKYIIYKAIYKYEVDGKEYKGLPRHGGQSWDHKKPYFTEKVAILYDPKNPASFTLKDSGVSCGCMMVAIAIAIIVIIISVRLHDG